MRYHTNLIGYLFGFGPKIIAEYDIAELNRDINIKVLKSILKSNVLLSRVTDQSDNYKLINQNIAIEKRIKYDERLREVDGSYGYVDLAEVNAIHKEMSEDWWLQQLSA